MTDSAGHRLLRPVLTLLSGTGVGLTISYLARPVLTRMYSPDEMGLLGAYIAFVAIGATMSSLRYEDALMTPETDKEAIPLFKLSLGLTLLVALLSSVLIVFRHTVASWFDKPDFAPLLVVVPLGILCLGGIRILESWLTRRNRFRPVSRGRVILSGTSAPLQIGSRSLGADAGGLIGGLVTGQFFSLLFLARAVYRRDRVLFSNSGGFASIAGAARRFRRFPVFSLPAAVLGVAGLHLAALLLFHFFDSATVGYYAQAYGLLAAPITLLGSAVTQVYFVRSAEAHREEKLGDLTTHVFGRLFGLGLFPILSVVLVGPDLFEIVLGPSFRDAGYYAQRIAPWLLLVFSATPLTRLFDVLEKQRAFLAFTTLGFVLRLTALVLGGMRGDPLWAIAAYGAAGLTVMTLQALWLLRLGKVSFQKLFLMIAAPVGITLVLLAILWLFMQLELSALPNTAFACLLGVLYLIVNRKRFVADD